MKFKCKGSVYFIKSGDLVKIGCTMYGPDYKVSDMSRNNPFGLEILYWIESKNMLRVEKEFHEMFFNKKVYREWYRLTNEDMELAKSIDIRTLERKWGHTFHFGEIEKNKEYELNPSPAPPAKNAEKKLESIWWNIVKLKSRKNKLKTIKTT